MHENHNKHSCKTCSSETYVIVFEFGFPFITAPIIDIHVTRIHDGIKWTTMALNNRMLLLGQHNGVGQEDRPLSPFSD